MAYLPKLSPICVASSLVGVRTNARIDFFHCIGEPCMRRWIVGNANAAVFPVPVCAHPNISAPLKTIGIDCACIGVGVVYQ